MFNIRSIWLLRRGYVKVLEAQDWTMSLSWDPGVIIWEATLIISLQDKRIMGSFDEEGAGNEEMMRAGAMKSILMRLGGS